MPAVAAIDIGYSNLKIAVGPRGAEPRVLVRPAGAAPADRLGERIREDRPGDAATPMLVEVRGRRWAAGIEPARLDGWVRSLHEDYARSDAYRALIAAALVLTGERQFDTVVTGLPVDQANDPRRCEALRQAILGTHHTDAGPIPNGAARQPPGAPRFRRRRRPPHEPGGSPRAVRRQSVRPRRDVPLAAQRSRP